MSKRLRFDEDEYQYIIEMLARTTLRMEKPFTDDDVLDRVKEIWVYNGTIQNLNSNDIPNRIRRDVVKEMLNQIRADYGANSLAYLAKTVGQLEQIRLHQFLEIGDIVTLFLDTQPDMESDSQSGELFWYHMIDSIKGMKVKVKEKHYCGVTFPITEQSLEELRTIIIGKTTGQVSSSVEAVLRQGRDSVEREVAE